ncbi:restriction endonuclease subunit S [Vibrio parahaemolyticus]|uniref:restriction endonuclease subunit S n=1 Tax=Vibrio parahaemolyticus TaxID=670 RepID=UPI00041677DE|nr:restriction endonuclease subunit S [Vibrio parahaemolyticus]MBA5912252.1 restriction endonuclease subunit S [Vibrio parahaemolyticus]MQD14399.1 restriction endonuclease subunit S [Vibrio parahaemolyticus]MQE12366.1 restriction endonuclease subunit S [Vibrio parahaemolyticus]HCG6076023.1 restriction endonuclease subunit S [Vibrio parahaemolyticus]HCG6091713.1 restriction endonuclease subunit S [Vibrio parahaemolyticus]
MSGKYQAYPEYKDSGVEWLGNIPSHWQVTPIKYLAALNPRKSAIDRTLLNKECNFLPMEKLKLNSIVLDEKRLVSDVYDGYTYFEDGDVLMAKVTPCFENKNIALASGLVNGVGFGSSEIYVLRSNEKTDNRFLYYRLQEDSFMDIATAAMTGAGGLKRVPSEVVNGYSLGTPEVEEQTQIANFLDNETAKIGTLIEKQQQLIKLLKEKRQAVISHAVTKGLNPEAPMKDSGVAWLGEVPEHWEVTRIKYLADLTPSKDEVKDNLNSECSFVPMEKLKTDSLKLDEVRLVWDVVGGYTYFKNGDILLAKVTPCFENKNMAIAQDLKNGIGFGSSEIYVLRPKQKALTEYIYYRLQEDTFIDLATGEMTGAGGLKRVPSDFLTNFKVALPDPTECSEIVMYIKHWTKKYDQLISAALVQVRLMQERRTALISAAVTGKIDVRNWQTPTSQDQALEQTA